jgi:hypothetical protein
VDEGALHEGVAHELHDVERPHVGGMGVVPIEGGDWTSTLIARPIITAMNAS